MANKTLIILQCRMGSKRLPGKALMKIMDKPIIQYQIERLARVLNVDDLILATTTKAIDDQIVILAEKHNIKYFRGDEDDVLSRYFHAAIHFNAKVIVRINGDCPLIDPKVTADIIDFYKKNADKFDYVSNILIPSYPVGLHTEVFSIESLAKAHNEAKSKEEREHVTPYIYRNPNLFKLKNIALNEDLSSYRLTLDYIEDFYLIEKIFERLYTANNNFSFLDVIELLKANKSWLKLNNGFEEKNVNKITNTDQKTPSFNSLD